MRRQVKTDMAEKAKSPPAITPENRENQLIALAYDLVEKRLRDGTATSAETTAILKLGSTKSRIEKQVLEKQMELSDAKIKAMRSAERVEELYNEAIEAMRHYQGADNDGH